ncbi:PH domain-containing protein [Paracoccus sp. TOH]|uniref:PH domain-containing protein n=1 Tax=Paracoccus sp. TOH TaxID=1263728 RepID=UPI0025AFFC64|nr:PH domain-containing protein [Paracoccus sp. TOH]WJS87215.1 PH domain-containing protein [Paracoccus sp. TOH]
MKRVVHRMHWWFFVDKLVPWLFAAGAFLMLLAFSGMVPDRFPLSRLSVPQDLYGRVRWYFGAAIAAGAVISMLIAVVQWTCTTLTIEGGYVVYAKGILSRTVAKVPVQEIASIDLTQTIFQRILNTGNLVIDMRGASLLRMNLLDDPVGIQNTVLEMRQGGREDLR